MTFATAHDDGLPPTLGPDGAVLDIAVIGSGISGLSAAWLLSQRHRVTLFEADSRPGGHSNTVEVPGAPGRIAVDTGFIVYNEAAYPNLSALFAHLGVATQPSEMSFAVSLDQGALEYSGTDLRGLFAQRSNLVSGRFWSMLRDLVRFYRQAPQDAERFGLIPLDSYLDARGYGQAFRDDHLYPMAAAIWSTSAARVGDYPTEAFVRFCENHHLLQLTNRPRWRTVTGGSVRYVERLTEGLGDRLRLDSAAVEVRRDAGSAYVRSEGAGNAERFDQVVIATHADQALRLLPDASDDEQRVLGAFGYYAADRRRQQPPCVTYWMNRLQDIPQDTPLVLTLNPTREPRPEHLIRSEIYEHPLFNMAAIRAQDELWSLQGRHRTWFCGAYFGSGFHEDGLQAGLAVAEALGGVRRPWSVANESGRIRLGTTAATSASGALA